MPFTLCFFLTTHVFVAYKNSEKNFEFIFFVIKKLNMNSCKICQQETKNKCSNCNQVFYCCVEHQKQDWKQHKTTCLPFKVDKNEQLGRHLTATRTIKPFEIILTEAPLIRGPSQISVPVCLGCLNSIEPNNYIECKKCGWPLCGIECEDSKEHKAECVLTSNRGQKVKVNEFDNAHPLYQCLTTLRCMELKKQDAAKWQKFQELESLEQQRRGSMQWKADLESIGQFIPKFFNLHDINEDFIMKTVGSLQINGHEVPTTDPPHVAIFYNASFLEHSCVPNLAKSFTSDGAIILWAPNGIKRNEHLSICYSDAVWSTSQRQQHLLHTKLFKCNCARCQDVSEFGTNYGALKCQQRNCQGLVLPASLKQLNSNWNCTTCKTELDKSYIASILEKAANNMQTMDKTIDNFMQFIEHHKKFLSDNHYYFCEAKLQLMQLIGKESQSLIDISDVQLDLKIQYGRQLLQIYELLAPCEVRMLGTISFELHSGLAERTRRRAKQTGNTCKEQLEEAMIYADKCVNYLQHESDIFIEGHILKQARINRDALRMALRA